VNDIRYRDQVETFSGTLPGSTCPQPWSCLFMVQNETIVQNRRSKASLMLGQKAIFMDESSIIQLETLIRRMTRSNNFGQFVIAACALRVDMRLSDNCHRVFKQKVFTKFLALSHSICCFIFLCYYYILSVSRQHKNDLTFFCNFDNSWNHLIKTFGSL